MSKNVHIALVGNPNCGKTALFNALTGSKQRVANYAGVTVEKKHGYFITPKNIKCTLIDLPGTYSLRSRSPDEKITRDVVMDQTSDEVKIDIILCIMDATNLSNGLRLILELKQSGKPIIVALNMMDIAKIRGYSYKLDQLKTQLDCEIIEIVAIKHLGLQELLSAIDSTIPNLVQQPNTWSVPDLTATRKYHAQARQIMSRVTLSDGIPSVWSDKIDNILLHPVLGILVLLVVLFLVFQSVFSWATIPQEYLQDGVSYLQASALKLFPGSLLGSLLGNGIIAGVGDRRDEDIVNLGRVAAGMFDEIIIRQDKNLRGRTEEEIIELMTQGIHQISSEKKITIFRKEKEAIEFAIRNATPGAFVTICSDVVPDALDQIMKLKEEEENVRV